MNDLAKTGRIRKAPNIGKFFSEIRSELKRVVWPTWKQVTSNTVTVLIICLIFGIIIWVADFIFTKLAEWIYQVKLVT